MKKIKLILAVLCVVGMLCSPVFAGQKYNAFEGRWETVPDSWQTKYNAFEGEWSYQPDNAKTEYNAFEGKWEWDSGHNQYGDSNNSYWEW